jgi:hypothetical protein
VFDSESKTNASFTPFFAVFRVRGIDLYYKCLNRLLEKAVEISSSLNKPQPRALSSVAFVDFQNVAFNVESESILVLSFSHSLVHFSHSLIHSLIVLSFSRSLILSSFSHSLLV